MYRIDKVAAVERTVRDDRLVIFFTCGENGEYQEESGD
jgi:hypothetical protein